MLFPKWDGLLDGMYGDRLIIDHYLLLGIPDPRKRGAGCPIGRAVKASENIVPTRAWEVVLPSRSPSNRPVRRALETPTRKSTVTGHRRTYRKLSNQQLN